MARLLLVYQPVEGGVARHVADLARGLDGAGHEVILCGPRRLDGVPVGCDYVELALARSVTPALDVRAVRRLNAIVDALAPDLIHAHSSKAGAIARLVRIRRPSVPVLYSPHGYAFAGHFERELERRAYRLIERSLAPLASRVLCVCQAEARLALEVGRAEQVRVVYNGVGPAPSSPQVDPTMATLKSTGPVICTLTQLRPGKGLETLLEALPQVLRAHPRVHLAIWGDGPERGELRSRAKRLGISDHIHLAGATDVPLDVLGGADLVAFPSLAEAFPYVILEAMSVGRAIVASDVGGIREALGGGAGALVPPSDPAVLGQALTSLLDDPKRARMLGNAAQQRVSTAFTIEAMVSGVVGVYGEVLSWSGRVL